MISDVQREDYILSGNISDAKFMFDSWKPGLAYLVIEGDNEKKYSNNFWEILLEISLFLNTIDDERFDLHFVKGITVYYFNITKDDISRLSDIFSVELDSFYKEKSFTFHKCNIEVDANFNKFPIPYLYFEDSTIHDFRCLNGFSGSSLSLKNNQVLKYTGNVVLGCQKLVIEYNNLDLSLFFLKTTANSLTHLSIFKDGGLTENDFMYISNFPNIKLLDTWGECRDIRWLDKLKHLVECRGISVPYSTLGAKKKSSTSKSSMIRRKISSTDRKKRKAVWHRCYGDRWVALPQWEISNKREQRKFRIYTINQLINQACCYNYFSQRWLYPEMYKLLELSGDEKKVWDNRITNYSFEEIIKNLNEIEEQRNKLIQWALIAPADSLIPVDFYDIRTQLHLPTRNTSLPFDDGEGIEYVEARRPIIISKLESTGPVLVYSRNLFQKKK